MYMYTTYTENTVYLYMYAEENTWLKDNMHVFLGWLVGCIGFNATLTAENF